MRKRIINQDPQNVSPVDQSWLDLQRLAQVELTSEDAAYPIEAALIPSAGLGWRAGQVGEQTIRLLFDELQRVRRIHTVDLMISALESFDGQLHRSEFILYRA